MSIRTNITLLSLCLIVSGCANSSGVLELAPDTYNITVEAAPARGGAVGAKKIALQEANTHCTSQGKRLVVQNFQTSQNHVGFGSYTGIADITFMCVSSDVTQPVKYEPIPDQVIKIENK